MNAATGSEILSHLAAAGEEMRACDSKIAAREFTRAVAKAVSPALTKAREETIAKMGGVEAVERANRMAVASMYAEQELGHTLD